jgi:hypothetical protein
MMMESMWMGGAIRINPLYLTYYIGFGQQQQQRQDTEEKR